MLELCQEQVILIVFILYVLTIFFIGFFATSRTKTLSDYVLGGRKLSAPIAALGAGTSDMSSWLLMALPAAFLLKGFSQTWLPLALILGAFMNWQFVAKRLRVFSELFNDSLTIPAFFDNRFSDDTKILRVSTALVILCFFTVYVSALFISIGLLVQNTLCIDYTVAVSAGALVIVIYTCVGGFLAISWIDFFQGILMFLALLIVPIVTIKVIGGITPMTLSLRNINPEVFNLYDKVSGIEILTLIAWGLGYTGQPHILVRFMSIKHEKLMSRAKAYCMSWMILALAGAIATGLAGAVYFNVNPLKNAETVFIDLAIQLFNPWISALLLAALLSAIMSSASAMLLACSSALVEDFYRTFFRKKTTQVEYLWIGRIAVCLVAFLSIWMALDPKNTIMAVVEYAWAGMGASFGPVIVLSLYWSRMTRAGAIAGMLTGAFVVILWHAMGTYGGIFKVGPMLPGFCMNSLMIIQISLLTKKPESKITALFRQASKRI